MLQYVCEHNKYFLDQRFSNTFIRLGKLHSLGFL